MEVPPRSASIVCDPSSYDWNDQAVDGGRAARRNWLEEPMSVYEVHLESWMKDPDGKSLTYRQFATRWSTTSSA